MRGKWDWKPTGREKPLCVRLISRAIAGDGKGGVVNLWKSNMVEPSQETQGPLLQH